ncbi:redoxin domain-containing protein [Actinoplanes sp. NEAU-A12]|uniref:Redoxin domain-containing protein n=1 Tax=Actinoplanes sandaracinus TaxID=3045177 RepID=A0ABT6WN31_9ACTN|nr:redoxin domain-containing protein [Actinoplanes sandaracinus]MDI6101136.1 redoxin domain-containing protein [Actinoplanes sandaracinus]
MSLTLAAGLAVSGCAAEPVASSPPAPPAGPAAAPSGAAPSAVAPVAVSKNLGFSGTTVAGQKFDAASLAGKPAILWFWAPWCATCASEAQSLADIHQEYGQKLGILGVAGLGSTADMKDFVSDFELGALPHLNDSGGKVWKRFGIAQQSWYVMLDSRGEIVFRGYLDDLQLTEKVQALTA